MIPVKNKTKNQKCRKFLKRNHYSTLKWFLQAMQNAAIESRTQLRLESEIEEQKAKLADFKLSKEQERTKLVHDMEKTKQDHKQKKAELEQQHKLEMRQIEHRNLLETTALFTKANQELNAADKAWDCEFLEKLNDMNVNLTDYLNTKNGPQITEEIRVVTTDTDWIKAS